MAKPSSELKKIQKQLAAFTDKYDSGLADDICEVLSKADEDLMESIEALELSAL